MCNLGGRGNTGPHPFGPEDQGTIDLGRWLPSTAWHARRANFLIGVGLLPSKAMIDAVHNVDGLEMLTREGTRDVNRHLAKSRMFMSSREVRATPVYDRKWTEKMGGGAWPFLVGGVICLVNSVNERDPCLLNSVGNAYALPFLLLRGTFSD